MSIGKTSRLEYIDALRGVAILLVVYQHVLTYGIWHGSVAELNSPWSIASVALRFRMPLFFFISGLFAYAVYDGPTLRHRVVNRLTRQLWPTLAICSLYNITFFVRSWHSFFFSSHNAGYWFTQSLVQVFVFYAFLEFGMQRLRLSCNHKAIVLGALTGVCVALSYFDWLPDGRIGGLLTAFYLPKTVIYAPFFFAGVMAKMWLPKFEKFASSWLTIALAASIIMISCVAGSLEPRFILGIAGILMLTGCFKRTASKWTRANGVAGFLKHLGRNTLPIYLYHYILLQVFAEFGLLEFLKGSYGGLSELPMVGAAALAIAMSCLLIDKTLKHLAGPLHKLLYNPILLFKSLRRENEGERHHSSPDFTFHRVAAGLQLFGKTIRH